MMSTHKYPIRPFLKNCIIVYDEFIPSILFRMSAVIMRKPAYSKPWRSENRKIFAEISTWPEDRIEEAYNYTFKFFKHRLKWGTMRERILYGSAHIAQVLSLEAFIDHAIILAAFKECSGSYTSALYLQQMDHGFVARRLNAWHVHMADKRHDRELARRHIAALTYLTDNFHNTNSDWYFSSEFSQRVKAIRTCVTQKDLKSIYMISR